MSNEDYYRLTQSDASFQGRRTLKQVQDNLDRMLRTGQLPTPAYLREVLRLAEQHAISPVHEAGIRARVAAFTLKAA